MKPFDRITRCANTFARAGLWLLTVWIAFTEIQIQASNRAADYYQTDVWSIENGLPSSSVTAIAQTADGYLWVGTYNGLARFDGVRFVTFDPANTPALTHARVRRLCVDAQGTLWINTYDGSLTTMRGEKFELEIDGRVVGAADAVPVSSSSNQIAFLHQRGNLIRKTLGEPAGKGWETIAPPSRITGAACCVDGEGSIWYRGRDQHLWRYRNGGFDSMAEDNGLQDQTIKCLTTDPAGRLRVGTEQEIAVWDGTKFQNATPTNGGPLIGMNFLFITEDNHFWAVANNAVYQGTNRQWLLEAEALRGVFNGNLSRMGAHEDHRGGVWLYDYGRGLFHVDSDGDVLRLNPEDGFPGERVWCFFEDREGNCWVGLDTGGLVRVRERTFQVAASGEGAFSKAAKSVCEDKDGTIWIGTLGGGLIRLHAGAVTNIDLSEEPGLGFAFCVCPDASGRLWASVGDEDLYVRDTEFTRVQPAVHGVKAILADQANRIWVGTKGGLLISGQARPEDFQLLPGVPHRDIRALSEDKSGVMWAGGEDGILYRISNNVTTAFSPMNMGASQAIWSLLADDDGTVWVGTFRGGLLRFRDGKFTRYSKSEGLPDNVICQILTDGRGNLWMGSQQGIFRVAKSALHEFARGEIKSIPCLLYGRYDGLPSLECSGGYQPAAWRAHDDRLWFATAKGAVSIQPDKLRPNLLPPLVKLEEVLVDGKIQDLRTQNQKSGASHSELLEVPPGKRQFEFHYTGVSLVSPDRVQFRYRLEGADEDWVSAGTRRSAQYNFLRAGTYRFCVAACNGDGVWSDTSCALSLKVLPPFFETWSFRVTAAVVVLVLVAGTVRYTVTRKLQRELEQLEQQRAVERERARIAKDIHDDLGAGLTQITLLSELARRDPPSEVESHLGHISEAARELTRAMDEIVWAIDPENDTLDGLVTYLCKFASEYLNVAGIRCRLDLPEPVPPHLLRAEVRHNLFLAMKEALNNVVKHARATQVEVRLKVEKTFFTFIIQDNGQGFSPQSESGPSPSSSRTLPGHGLVNLEKRLAAIGGCCRIISAPGKGTSVELTVNFARTGSPVLASPQTGTMV